MYDQGFTQRYKIQPDCTINTKQIYCHPVYLCVLLFWGGGELHQLAAKNRFGTKLTESPGSDTWARL